MDTEGYLCKKSTSGGEESDGAAAARQALATIGMMQRRLRMAEGWFRTIERVHKYFVRIKKDFRRNAKALAENPAIHDGSQLGFLSLREGGYGGGLEEFKMIEMTLKEFGSLEDQDVEMMDGPDASESVTSAAMKSDPYTTHERSPEGGPVRQDQWNAINNAPASVPTTEPATNGSQLPYNPTQLNAPSTSTSPSTSTGPPGQSHFAMSNGTSPIVSPLPHAQVQFPSYPSTQPAHTQQVSVNLQQQVQPPQPPPAPPLMTAEQTEQWLQSLDTRFNGEDVTAFVEGKDWQDWPSGATGPLGVGGWLSTVWATPSRT
jgi:hypothetical protein